MTNTAVPETREVAEAVVRLPRIFLESGDLSAYAILEQSGYIGRHDDVTPDLLTEILKSDTSLIDDWLAFSEDKRTNSGWYFYQGGAGFTVGLIDDRGQTVDEDTYCDRIEACAKFIKKEVEEMRQSG